MKIIHVFFSVNYYLKNREELKPWFNERVNKIFLDYLKISREKLKRFAKRGVNFERDEDYLNIENYQLKKWFVNIDCMHKKIMEEKKVAKWDGMRDIYDGLYDFYREVYKYKHFHLIKVAFAHLGSANPNSCLERKFVLKSLFKIHHYLLIVEGA